MAETESPMESTPAEGEMMEQPVKRKEKSTTTTSPKPSVDDIFEKCRKEKEAQMQKVRDKASGSTKPPKVTTPKTVKPPKIPPGTILEPTQAVIEECKQFELSYENLCSIKERMKKSFQEGLKKETHPFASTKCWITYVQDLPTGKETGTYLAVDLGGTHFRVLMAMLEDGKIKTDHEIYDIPDEIVKSGTAEQLFDHLAQSVIDFRKAKEIPEDQDIPLGFTFSFPMNQKALDKGILVAWTKGFETTGVVGNDVVQLLRDAFYRKQCTNTIVCAVLNDTVGTLIAAAWEHKKALIGLIVGTGCNACYVEKVENAELFDLETTKPNIIINIEWGNYGHNGELEKYMTEYDKVVDATSSNPGLQLFEKMISGLYQGELVRLLLVKLGEAGDLFGTCVAEELKTPGIFTGRYVTQIELKDDELHNKCFCLLKEAMKMPVNEQDCFNIRYICKVITTRAAKLVSAGLGAVIDTMKKKRLVIAVDGSVYKHHKTFHPIMCETLQDLMGPKIKYKIVLAEDGSGKGATLLAAVSGEECLQKELVRRIEMKKKEEEEKKRQEEEAAATSTDVPAEGAPAAS